MKKTQLIVVTFLLGGIIHAIHISGEILSHIPPSPHNDVEGWGEPRRYTPLLAEHVMNL